MGFLSLEICQAAELLDHCFGSKQRDSAFICLGCGDKVLRTVGLKQQIFIFSEFWRLGVQDQSVGRVTFSEASLLGL